MILFILSDKKRILLTLQMYDNFYEKCKKNSKKRFYFQKDILLLSSD